MSKTRIKNILMIGSGPTQIGRDTENETATIQIINNFSKKGHKLFYVTNNANSIVAELQDKVELIINKLDINSVISILREKEIDSIIPIVGNTVALQLCEQLIEADIITDLNIRILGLTPTTIHNINNPELINRVLKHIKEPTIPTTVVDDEKKAVQFAKRVGYPVLVKPVASLTKTNRINCENEHQLLDVIETALKVSSTHQIAVEKSVMGNKEIEMTVIRDAEGSKLLVNGAEDFNPVGVHSGDSIVFSPIQTLTDTEFQALRYSALKITEILRVKGVCHVQFALDPSDGHYFVTRINPFFDRNCSFAARATGYPIAYVVSEILLGKSLREISLSTLADNTALALIEPTMDHVAVRFPTWSFASFKNAEQELNTKMKSTGAVMAFGRSAEEALQKAIRSVDSTTSAEQAALDESQLTEAQLINVLIHPRAGQVYYLLEAIRRGYTVDELAEITHIDAFYFYKLRHLVKLERNLRENHFDANALKEAKYFGFGDTQIARVWNSRSDEVREFRLKEAKVKATYKAVEPTAGEFPYLSNTYYSTFEDEDEAIQTPGKKILILGTANSQVGTNSAAEYTTYQTILKCKELGYKVLLINNNPNALSLIPSLADQIYLEPLTVENCLNIIKQEEPSRILAQGKWEVVSQLINRGVKVDQLPLSRTTRAENISSDYISVLSKVNDEIHYFGMVHSSDKKLVKKDFIEDSLKEKMKSLSISEGQQLTYDGLFVLLVDVNNEGLIAKNIVPMSIQDLPFLSFCMQQDFAGILTQIILNHELELNDHKIIAGNYEYCHVFPYNQFGIEEPINAPYSLAIGAELVRKNNA